MFSCACSLRSAQCAALIALATAAGLTRFVERAAEVAAPADSASRGVALETREIEPVRAAKMDWFQVPAFFQAWFAGEPQVPADDSPDDHPVRDRLTLDVPWTVLPFRFNEHPLTLRSVDHALPFAVGPPRKVAHSRLDAAGTAPPGDTASSSSRSSTPVATLLAELPRHPTGSAEHPHVPRTLPAFALRGDAESPLPIRPPGLAAALPGSLRADAWPA